MFPGFPKEDTAMNPTPAQYTTHTQYATQLAAELRGWLRRHSRRLPAAWREAALVLLRLNLDPARPLLQPLYAPGPRGRPPHDPLCMLRALVLMLLLQYKSLGKWVDELRAHPRLAQMAGFAPFRTPGVGTFYDFLDRLEDGPYAPPCPHRVRLSRLRKGRHRRHLKREQAQRHAAQAADLQQADSVTARLAQELLAAADQPRPQALLTRLEDLLFQCGVLPSAQRGLVGDLEALVLAGDGACLPTGASPHAQPTCDCRAQGLYRCDHERVYTDPTATWGYDAYREVFFFGHRYFQHCVVTPQHTLPLQVLLAPGHTSECTLGPTSLDRLLKLFTAHGLPVTVRVAVYDAGLDAQGIYTFLHAKRIAPVIALNPRRGGPPAPTGTAQQVNDHGVPLCPAGLPMRRHSADPSRYRIYYNCPVKRPTHRHGQLHWVAQVEACPRQVLCQPDTQMGPVVYVRTADDPRLYPPIPRDSPAFKALMAQRTGCERSNSLKKVTYRLAERPCRSATHLLVRLYLASLLEHAQVWLAEDRKRLGDAPQALLQPEALAA
jgi:Transposase domain (DUF772)/Transposase DDE domain